MSNIFLFLQVDALRFYQLQLFEDQDIKTQPQFNYAWQKNGFNMAKLMSTGSLGLLTNVGSQVLVWL